MEHFNDLITLGVTFPDKFVYFKACKVNLMPAV